MTFLNVRLFTNWKRVLSRNGSLSKRQTFDPLPAFNHLVCSDSLIPYIRLVFSETMRSQWSWSPDYLVWNVYTWLDYAWFTTKNFTTWQSNRAYIWTHIFIYLFIETLNCLPSFFCAIYLAFEVIFTIWVVCVHSKSWFYFLSSYCYRIIAC